VFPRGTAFIPPNTGRQPGLPGVDGGQCKKDSDCGAWFGPASSGACEVTTHQCSPDSLVDVRPFRRNYDLPVEVHNDCDLSSKTFAVKYLSLMKIMGGRGLTLSTDMNGFLGMINPRYGALIAVKDWPYGGTPGKDVCGGNKRAMLDGNDR